MKSVTMFTPSEPIPPTIIYKGYRVLHHVEGGRPIPTGMPAICPPIDTFALPMTEEVQRMSYALMRHFNPTIDGQTWRALHGYFLAMTNGSQNGYDGTILHADFINNRDLRESPPRYDKCQRTFQGSFIRGDVVGNELVCKPGIHGIDATKPLPSIQYIVAHQWYSFAVTAGETIHNFPQGAGLPVVYPMIMDRPIRFPLQWFESWEKPYLPDPLEFYITP